jgi:hypothetical protein
MNQLKPGRPVGSKTSNRTERLNKRLTVLELKKILKLLKKLRNE